jgi:hypothetical protein
VDQEFYGRSRIQLGNFDKRGQQNHHFINAKWQIIIREENKEFGHKIFPCKGS